MNYVGNVFMYVIVEQRFRKAAVQLLSFGSYWQAALRHLFVSGIFYLFSLQNYD